jgi:hypothetical protein
MTPELHATISAKSCATSHVTKFTGFFVGFAAASAERKKAVRRVLAVFNFNIDECH